MRFDTLTALCLCSTLTLAQQTTQPDPIATMVGRLNLEAYKATIKGLTQFGDRRQGTDRNRAAIDWIEAQLKSYGCTNTERIHYDYTPPATPAARNNAAATQGLGPGRARRRGTRSPDAVNNDPLKQPDLALRELNTEPSTPESTAPKSARRIRKRCILSRRIWTASAGARPPMTTARAPRW